MLCLNHKTTAQGPQQMVLMGPTVRAFFGESWEIRGAHSLHQQQTKGLCLPSRYHLSTRPANLGSANSWDRFDVRSIQMHQKKKEGMKKKKRSSKLKDGDTMWEASNGNLNTFRVPLSFYVQPYSMMWDYLTVLAWKQFRKPNSTIHD